MPDLLTAFALIGTVLVLSAMMSGIIERAPVSFPMIFLGLGFLLGPRGLDVIRVDPHNPALEAIAILSLSFVLFLDAVNLQLGELRHDWLLALCSLPAREVVTGGLRVGPVTAFVQS